MINCIIVGLLIDADYIAGLFIRGLTAAGTVSKGLGRRWQELIAT